MTLLHWAAWYKQLETIKILLQFGAKVDVKDVRGSFLSLALFLPLGSLRTY